VERLFSRVKASLTFLVIAVMLCVSGCANIKQANQSSTSLSNFLGFSELPDWYLTSKYSYADSKWIENDFGTKIHYRDVGEGPVILLLHGEMSSLHVWEDWINILSEDFRLIAIDLPGSGLTGAPHCISNKTKTCSDNLTSDYIAHTIEYFIEDLGINKLSIVGSSYAGYLAAQYAGLQHPEKIDRLVLISPKGYQQDIPSILKQTTTLGFSSVAKYIQPAGIVTEIVDQFYGAESPDIATTQRYLHLAQSDGAHKSNINQLNLVRALMEYGMLLDLDDIEAPTLIMWGGSDKWGDPSHAKRWQEGIDDSVLVTYPNYGHALMEEGKEITAADAAAFINDEPLPSLTDGVGEGVSIEDQLGGFDKASLFGGDAMEMEDAE
jgi:pimeloyl-ACP methyl ester carboxylesterase